jgi:hypothetical protein
MDLSMLKHTPDESDEMLVNELLDVGHHVIKYVPSDFGLP